MTDLRLLNWGINSPDLLGTGGTYLKAVYDDGNTRYYYKLSNYDRMANKIVGYEAIFEVVIYKLCNLLSIESLRFDLVDALIQIDDNELQAYISVSKEFKRAGEKKFTLEDYFDIYRQPKEMSLEFCKRVGFSDYINKMFLIDFLICNRDRHGANIEVLVDTHGNVRLSPLFDNGLSFIAPYGVSFDAISHFNVMSDFPVINFIGYRSLFDNLGLIDKPVVVSKLTPESRDILLADFKECLPPVVQNKIWEQIWRRYQYARDKGILTER